MESSLECAIGDRLPDYLNGAGTLDQSKDWLIPVTWDMPDDGDSAAIELSYEAQLAPAGQSSGLSAEPELRDALADLISVAW